MGADKTQRDEQDLERYGVWVKTGPNDVKPPKGTSIDLVDLEDTDGEDLLITDEEEKLLGDLEFSSPPISGELADSAAEDFLDDDLLLAEPAETDYASIPGGDSKNLLKKIEGEISSLREEIRGLKDELSGLRVPGAAVPEGRDTGGFFEDEDDETIALTGDELDNILDTTEMTGEAGAGEGESVVFVDEDAGVEISQAEMEDIETIITDVDIDEVFETEVPEMDEDFSLSVVGSPSGPEAETTDQDYPEIIEIDIPGLDETALLSGTEVASEEPSDGPVVSIDDITEEFEEITDLDSISFDDESPVEIPTLDDIREEEPQVPLEAIAPPDIPDTGDVFDEGEEVEIDLGDIGGDGRPKTENADAEIQMEEVSLDDFGIGGNDVPTDQPAEDTDDLRVDEDLNLDSYISEIEDSESEDFDNLNARAANVLEDYKSGDLAKGDAIPEIPDSADAEGFDVLEIEDLEDIALPGGPEGEGKEIDGIEDVLETKLGTSDELSLAEDEPLDDELIEELELDSESDSDEISVTVPDDDFSELPGTEAVDLGSLEALAGAPDLSEEATDELVELPEVELGDESEDGIAELPEIELGDAPDDEMAELAEMGLDDETAGEMVELPEIELGDAPDDEMAELSELGLDDETAGEMVELAEMDLGDESDDELVELPEMGLDDETTGEMVELAEMDLGDESDDEMVELPEIELGDDSDEEIVELAEMGLGDAPGDEMAELAEMDLDDGSANEMVELPEIELGDDSDEEIVELSEMGLGDAPGDEMAELAEMDLDDGSADEMVELSEIELGDDSDEEIVELADLPETDLAAEGRSTEVQPENPVEPDILSDDEDLADFDVELPDIEIEDADAPEAAVADVAAAQRESLDVEEITENDAVEIDVDGVEEVMDPDSVLLEEVSPDHAAGLSELEGEIELPAVEIGDSVGSGVEATNELEGTDSHESLEIGELPEDLKDEIKDVLKYMDQLLESLPEEKIQEFARSEHFEVYKKIFEELGISD